MKRPQIDPPKGTHPERSRHANRKAVLNRIQLSGQLGRAEIARSLGLSTQAISNIINELQDDGMLLEAGMRVIGRGQPVIQYKINPNGGYALGVEIRPDAVFVAILDMCGGIVETRRSALPSSRPDKVIDLVCSLRDSIIAQKRVDTDRMLGAGIVMPGPFGQTGLSDLGSDLTGWHALDAAPLFEEALKLPVTLSNDANAAAMSEKISGIAQGLSHFAYLYFGAGLGLGLVSQGHLITGAFGNVGEIGHIPVITNEGPRPLETLVSRVAVQNYLRSDAPLDIPSLAALFAESDRDLMDWLSVAKGALGQAIGLIENIFDPQTIILGGAMPASILEYLTAETPLPDRSVSNRSDGQWPRLQTGLSGRMTATVGAASLVLNRALTPHPSLL